SMFPKDAAEYAYTKAALGKMLAFFIGYFVILSAIISSATVAAGFAGYFSALFGIQNLVAIAIVVIIFFSIINILSVKGSSWTNIAFTLMEVFGLLLITVLGFMNWGDVSYIEMPDGFLGVLKGAALVFFAFVGFESVVKLSEECKNPRKTIPRALLLSILITTILYILVAVSAVTILDWQMLATSKAPLATAAANVLGDKAFLLLSVIALFSTANTVLISLLAGSRALYGIGKSYLLLKPFTRVHKKFRTPHFAIIAVMLFSILFALIEDIGLIAELTNFTLFITFAVINTAVIVLRYTMPERKRAFTMPINIGKLPLISVIGIISCLFLLAQLTMGIILGGLALAMTGLLLYLVVIAVEHKGLNQK
ncbi:amino acid permease, partial [Candidatus Peregrinibacteria bacterium]|nr:amino acid permease [Candidatus Peregrinibacteria bacterium]